MSLLENLMGGIEKAQDTSSTRYSAKFYVLDEHLEDWVPDVGDEVSWASGCRVENCSRSWMGPGCWEIAIEAVPASVDFEELNSDDLGDYIEKSYAFEEIYCPKEWWGIREASQSDIDSGLKNINDSTALLGDFVFRDASDSDKGSPEYSKSPFSNCSESKFPSSWADQIIPTKTYSCSFYTKRKISNISDFIGINGSFSAKCRPGDRSSGQWLAIRQELSTVKDKDGSIWTRINRKIKLAPNGLIWDSDKNGGIWSW